MSKNEDFSLRGPVSTDVASCAVDWNCIDLTQRTIVRGTPTYTYCGVGRKRKLVDVHSPTPAPSTATVQGLEEEIIDMLMEFHDSNCPTWMQRVGCDGVVEHYSGVRWGDNSSVNPLTASGPDATGATLVESVSVFFDRMYKLKAPSKTNFAQYVTSGGYYDGAGLTGTVDGVNTIFTLPTDPLENFPVVIYIDGVLESSANYTITGDTVVFTAAPACGEVITADYYDTEFLIQGLTPVRVMYAGEGCGSDSCTICQTVYAVYDTTVPSDPDSCGASEGTAPAVAIFRHTQGVLELRSINLLSNVANINDAIATKGGDLIIAAESGLYEGCNDVAVAVTDLAQEIRRLAYDYEADTIYGLFGNSGVMRRNNSGVWVVAVNDNGVTSEYQNDIAASSGVVVTGGEANSVTISTNAGGLFVAKDGPGTAVEEIVAVTVGSAGSLSEQTQLIGVLTQTTSATYFYVSGDLADDWSEVRRVWNYIASSRPFVKLFENWLVFVSLDDEAWRNANKGCAQCGAWEDMPNEGLETQEMAICPYDPNRLVSIARPSEAAVADFGTMSGVALTVESFNVLANDYTEVDGSSINPATLAVVSNTASADATAAVVANEIQVTADNLNAPGTQAYIVYTVDTTGGSTLTGTLVVAFT